MSRHVPPPDSIEIHPAEGARLAVEFRYRPDRVKRICAIPGRRWHPRERRWTVPAGEDALDRIRKAFASDRL